MDSKTTNTKDYGEMWGTEPAGFVRYESIAGDKSGSEPLKWFRIGSTSIWEIEEDIRLCLKLLGGADFKSPGCEAAKRALSQLHSHKHYKNIIPAP